MPRSDHWETSKKHRRILNLDSPFDKPMKASPTNYIIYIYDEDEDEDEALISLVLPYLCKSVVGLSVSCGRHWPGRTTD